MGGGGHVVDASNGPRRLRAGGRVDADGGVVVAASLTQAVFVVVVVQVVVVASRRRWWLVASTQVVVVDVVVGCGCGPSPGAGGLPLRGEAFMSAVSGNRERAIFFRPALAMRADTNWPLRILCGVCTAK